MMERFLGGEVAVQLNKTSGMKLVNRGILFKFDDNGVFINHGRNQISFIPYTNILRIDLLKEATSHDS